MNQSYFDVIIIGAGASGTVCAWQAAKRKRSVLIIEHCPSALKKVLISGGGRCNFTNLSVDSSNYVSQTKNFCKSAISRFKPTDFISLLQEHKIKYEQREHGQLFCKESAKQICDMLLNLCKKHDVKIQYNCTVNSVTNSNNTQHNFTINTNKKTYTCTSLVIATGSKSLPEIGATDFALKIAQQLNIHIQPTAPALVPLTLHQNDKDKFSTLSGIAVKAIVKSNKQSFMDNLLFTHRGLSGPVILQISNYWNQGDEISINFLPQLQLIELLQKAQKENPKLKVSKLLYPLLPKRLVETLLEPEILNKAISEISKKNLMYIQQSFCSHIIKPAGCEGYRTAEATKGGISCTEVSSKTFQTHKINGLFFIGESLDVTGWLGGYNLHWAWASGWCAGQQV